ncbi:MAG: V-type ATP synthase subunit E family protein [Candidatus Omnitrophica bacterium]|nr:V-type ATP synthase subunit E family protein [Candidatus Omnitrophota bacterium]
MAEEIKGLIEKIQQEGIRVAEEKAKEIEEQAKKRAEEIIQKAKQQAQEITRATEEKIAQMQANNKVLLKQAGRDFLLTVRGELNSLLNKLILAKVREALTPQGLSEMLTYIIKETVKAQPKSEIIITLKPDDLKIIKETFLSSLSEEVKKGLMLTPSDEITAGFLISYDSGKSQFDFSDKALADFIATSIKPRLKELLKDTV